MASTRYDDLSQVWYDTLSELPICGLFNNAVKSSDNMALDD
jgi:hypothetical protein